MRASANFTFKAGSYSSEDLLVERFHGKEGMSELFNFTIDVAIEKNEIDFAEVIGKPALLTILNDYGKERFVNGIIIKCEFISERKAYLHYRMVMAPSFWLLGYRRNCRIFQEMTVPDIIKKIFDDAGFTSDKYKISLQASYNPRDYCVQYRESDFDFVSRLMEEEGIFYFFEHEEGTHTMVLADSPTPHKEIDSPSTIVYREQVGQVPDKEYVYSYNYHEKIRPGTALLRDYFFVKPTLDLECTSNYKENKDLEIYNYPGKYADKGIGDNYAKVQLEQFQVERKVSIGKSVCRHFIPGYKFTLDEHPNAKFNTESLLIQVTHEGSQPQVTGEEAPDKAGIIYKNQYAAIPADVPFRPARNTAKPTIGGNQTAMVVGPAGEEIYTDEHGRIKVQFYWDREGEKNEKSSCWIRVAQLWSGNGWGGLFIPRISQEVVVSFLEGDPDRPMVVGCVYNGDNAPPYALPDDMTKSTVKSESSLGGGGFNEIRYEDKKDSEEIYIHAQKDTLIRTENDKNQSTGHDETLTIENDRTKTVANDEKTDVGNNRTENVGKNESITIGETRTESVGKNESITIGDSRTETVGKDESITIGNNRTESVGKNENITIGETRTEDVGKDESISIGNNRVKSIGKSETITIGKDKTITIGGDRKISIDKSNAMAVTKDYSLTAKKISIKADDIITLKTGSASITMKKNGDIQIKGKKINIKGSGDVIIKGSKILGN